MCGWRKQASPKRADALHQLHACCLPANNMIDRPSLSQILAKGDTFQAFEPISTFACRAVRGAGASLLTIKTCVLIVLIVLGARSWSFLLYSVLERRSPHLTPIFRALSAKLYVRHPCGNVKNVVRYALPNLTIWFSSSHLLGFGSLQLTRALQIRGSKHGAVGKAVRATTAYRHTCTLLDCILSMYSALLSA
jgi:hypothetical protein